LGQTRTPGGKDSQPSNTESQKRDREEKKAAEVKERGESFKKRQELQATVSLIQQDQLILQTYLEVVYTVHYIARQFGLQGYKLAQWLRFCATNRKVAGSIPDGVIGFFH
jgi:hypothetical protein